MRVLLATTDFAPVRGGIQTMLREFCERTSAEVRVVAPADPGHEALDASLPFRIRRVRTFLGSSRRAYIPSIARAAVNEAREFSPDVFFAGHVFAAPAGVLLSTPLVVGTYGVELVAPRARFVAARVLPRADRVLAVSHFTRDRAVDLGAKPERVEVIPVGAPAPLDADPARIRERFGLKGKRVVLTVARLEQHKGVDRVIAALGALGDDVTYLVVGDGSARAAFEGAAARSGVAHRVVFAGSLGEADLAAAYRAADAFVLASRAMGGTGVEGCPVALLEAAAYGLPIVAGRTGGIADAVRDGVTGLLVDPENTSDIAAALGKALDPIQANPLASAAAEMARTERNWQAVVERMERLLEAAISSFRVQVR